MKIIHLEIVPGNATVRVPAAQHLDDAGINRIGVMGRVGLVRGDFVGRRPRPAGVWPMPNVKTCFTSR